ncbi:hypothetical protein MTR_2g074955 [Medicago truncatula]|uniref:Uncharacterized protein n=1 Tax=Medicago truncatula TaxID=3880 RepID=A0A072VKA3_MEDTR|nr:hypothetical protein MTR_2g074955 [Medicago truncatula]
MVRDEEAEVAGPYKVHVSGYIARGFRDVLVVDAYELESLWDLYAINVIMIS